MVHLICIFELSNFIIGVIFVEISIFCIQIFIFEIDNAVEDFSKLQNFLDIHSFLNGTISKLTKIRLSRKYILLDTISKFQLLQIQI